MWKTIETAPVDTEVLIYSKPGNRMAIGSRGAYRDAAWFVGDSMPFQNVTHWMPLPETPND